MSHFRNLSSYLGKRNNKFSIEKSSILRNYFNQFNIDISNVIEIGPGPGIWSDELLMLCLEFKLNYILLEPDIKCFEILKEKYKDFKSVSILNITLESYIFNNNCSTNNVFFVFDAFNYLNIESIVNLYNENQPLIVYQVHSLYYYLYYLFINLFELNFKLCISRMKSILLLVVSKFDNNFDKAYSKTYLLNKFPKLTFVSNTNVCKSFFPHNKLIFAFTFNF